MKNFPSLLLGNFLIFKALVGMRGGGGVLSCKVFLSLLNNFIVSSRFLVISSIIAFHNRKRHPPMFAMVNGLKFYFSKVEVQLCDFIIILSGVISRAPEDASFYFFFFF